MSITDIIKQTLTMHDIATHYGFEPDRQGFICCPFHNEKTPSLKIYENGKGYYCFGCGAGGDVINFVMRLFDENFSEAARRINIEFNLGLPFDRKMSLREKYELKDKFEKRKQKQLEEKQKRERLTTEWLEAYGRWIELDKILRQFKPNNPDEQLNPQFVKALHELETVAFQLEEKEMEVILCAR